ncbi:MAG: NAD-dependent epimerase/dehydratase family protein, partial [Crocinitomicaceae bacterium]|nr:NAD-dependent epimerase/dehydratase family protein [Crocinitomicaceae bacterium]
KIQQAKEVEVWGTGAPKREFLHVDDLAEACFFLLQNYSGNEFLNIGTGEDLSIKELALKVKTIIGFEGELVFDTTKPDGTPRKLMNVQKVNSLGWRHKISLDEGIKAVYDELIATNYLTQLV